MVSPIEGMESVVATVSGYHGSERFNLIKLISHSGGSYVGAMSKSTTHLVCWKFEGRKYSLAKKFKTIIVNHRWVEDCIKQGKRVSERPYIMQSGQDVGPLLLEVPLNAGVLQTNQQALSDQYNICDDSKRRMIDMGCGSSDHGVWIDSCLLNDDLLHEFGKRQYSSRKSKCKPVRKTSKSEHRSSSKYCIPEPSLSRLDISEHEESSFHSSMNFAREKRKISNVKGSTASDEPYLRGRRLVKKNLGRDKLGLLLSDSDQEAHPIRVHSLHDNSASSSKNSEAGRNINILGSGRTFGDGLNNRGILINEAFEDVEEIKDWNHLPVSRESNLCSEDAPNALERTSQDKDSDVESLKENTQYGGHREHVTRLHTSLELSCVICWTDFSSTRGILPCGHRFCYSCIQNWADHMVSRRKISTCPLCKANFVSITKVEDAATSDQKIYSQTVPYAPTAMDSFILTYQEPSSFGAQSSIGSVCSKCSCLEPEDCLIRCHLCQIRCIHSYCLDPPLLPWTCIHCKDLQMLYHHTR